MKRSTIAVALGAALGLAVAASALQSAATGGSGPPPIAADNLSEAAPLVRDVPPKPSAEALRTATPMAERVAVLGLLNKRNGLSRDLTMKPGEAVRIGGAVIRLKACDRTEPWEKDQLTGAFVQVIVKNVVGDKWRQVFSGWLFKESPSLNVVEHPVYDVWVKTCTMRQPEVGPNTVVLSGEASGAAGGRSKARKSPRTAPDDDAPDSAESSNAI